MKNLYVLLFSLITTVSMAQIGIIENFDNSQNTLPFGWTTEGFAGLANTRSCDNVSYFDNATTNDPSGSLTTPYLADASNATDLVISFDYKATTFSFFGGETNAPTDWGSLTLEYTTNNGTSWTNIVTLDESNYDPGATCTTKSYTILGAVLPTGTDFQARFVTTHLNGTWQLYLDNISMVQTATQAPSCDAVITMPENGAIDVDLDTDLAWSNANGLPTGYKLSVGTTVGGTDVVDAEDVGNVNNYAFAADLEYETTYYVTVLPYNGFGDSMGDCVENSFTTRPAPLAGSSCANPIVVDPTALDYTTQDSTSLYEDLHSTTPCGGNFSISGKEVVYTMTPTEIMSVNLELTNIVGSRTTLHVMDGCPEDGPNCYGFGDSSNSLDDVVIDNMILDAGVTYYFYIANTSNNSSTYDFTIHENSCIIPAAEFTAVGDCDNGEFSIDVNVSSMGSATSLTIADDQGSADAVVSATGITTFGPYTSATLVNFTITNDQDNTCQVTDSLDYYCPPANDVCADAQATTVNAGYECQATISGTTIAATESIDNPSGCGNGINDVWYSFVAINANHAFQLLNIETVIGNNGTMYFEVLEGTCGSLTSFACNSNNTGYGSYSGFTPGQTYYVRVYSANAANSHNFDLCISTVPAAPSNDECSTPIAVMESDDDTCNYVTAGTPIGASNSADNSCSASYIDVWYSFTPAETGDYIINLTTEASSVYHYVYSGTCGALTPISGSCFSSATSNAAMTQGETYTIMVRSNVTTPGVDFELCVYQFVPVANNDCSNAEVLMESPDVTGENTVLGSTEAALYSPEGCASSSSETVWYTFTPMYDGLYHVNLEAIEGTPYFQMYTGDCDGGFTPLAELGSCFNDGTEDVVLEAGVTYYIDVHSSASADFALFAYPDPTIVPVPVPDNDLCADAIELLVSDDTCNNMAMGTTQGATTTTNNACAGTRDVWYTFMPDADGYYEFTVSENDTVTNHITLYSGACDALSPASELCAGSTFVELLTANETYYVMVGTATSVVGVSFELCAKPFATVVNNDCMDSETITESPDDTGANAVMGTTEAAFYSTEGCAIDIFSTVWYTFVPTQTGLYHVNHTGGTEDSFFQVYTGDCETGLTALDGLTECNNVGDIAISVEAGETYYISVQSLAPATFELFVYPDISIGITEAKELNISYFPNPTSDVVNIIAPNVVSNVTVYNVLGAVVLQANPNARQSQIDLSTFTDGIFIINVKMGQETGLFRVVKQ